MDILKNSSSFTLLAIEWYSCQSVVCKDTDKTDWENEVPAQNLVRSTSTSIPCGQRFPLSICSLQWMVRSSIFEMPPAHLVCHILLPVRLVTALIISKFYASVPFNWEFLDIKPEPSHWSNNREWLVISYLNQSPLKSITPIHLRGWCYHERTGKKWGSGYLSAFGTYPGI